ncbi:unnamed protein product [Plutella xylostella]|uniref:Luciferin 4-monooxygenase n=1 Tax=Plutella xylostella TaxID=51655 RepID=A0A8S4DL14_PLUXY|nr:unnamed protein product [Plutella xylostella]
MASKLFYRSTRRLVMKRDNLLNISRNMSSWTPDLVVKSTFKDIEIPSVSTCEHIFQNIDKWADKTAVVCGFTGRSYSYHEVYKYSRNLAARLRRHYKIRDHDVICVMLPNLPDFPIAVFGVLQAGAVVTTLNPIYTAHEVSRQLSLSDAKLVITIPETAKVVYEAMNINKTKIPVICVTESNENLPTGAASLNDLIKDTLMDTSILKEVNIKTEDVCFLPYSSGTTGLPKGVQITNRNIIANLEQQEDEKLKQYRDTTKSYQDKTLVVLPLFHIYGLTILMLHKLSIGSQLVTVPKFQGSTFLNVLEKHKISLFYAAPPIVLFMASSPAVNPHHLSHVDMFMCAAAPLPLADVEKLFTKAERKLDFLQGYGLTETSPLVSSMTRHTDNYGSVGFAVAGTQLRVVDQSMNNLGPNLVGELLVKGPQVMKGYKNNEEATRAAITSEGWFRTGDQASIAEDGALVIHDRLKELIKVKGFQVPPAELESVLKEHPKILDAAVVGAPDHRHGEVPKAFVVVRDGHALEKEEIINFVKERVAEYKRINDVEFLDAIPKNPSGKILRRILKEKYC